MNDAEAMKAYWSELIREDSVTMFEESPTQKDIAEGLELCLDERLPEHGFDIKGMMVEYADIKVHPDDHKQDGGYIIVVLADQTRLIIMITESVDSGYGSPAYLAEIRKIR